MGFIDTHCHIHSLDSVNTEDNTARLWEKSGLRAEQILNNATAEAVDKMICVGCDLSDSEKAVAFASEHNPCFAAVGIHPHEARNYRDKKYIEQFKNLLNSPKVVAIGECGLDYFYEYSPREVQQKILTDQLKLAQEFNIPVIFHVREALGDFWPLFDSFPGLRGVLHSYSDSQENLDLALNRGLYIGVNGIATFTKNSDQLAMYKNIPLTNLLLETDAPYLTPAPYRGTVNEPKRIPVIAKFLGELRGEDTGKIAKCSSENANLLFAL